MKFPARLELAGRRRHVQRKPRSRLSLWALVSGTVCVLALAMSVRAPAQTTSALPAPTGYVNDYAHVVNADTKQQLETMLTKLDQEQQIQFAVVTVDTTNGQDIFDFSLAVARKWGIGAKDVQKPSLLLVVAIKDRSYQTQVSRHLEGDLPDGLVGEIQRKRLVPAFRAGDYGRGIVDTIREYIATLATKRGFGTANILGAEATPEPTPVLTRRSPIAPLIILGIAIIVILIVSRRGGGRGFGGRGGGWPMWLVINTLLNSGRGSSSNWSGGGFGGFGGSGGGGFGGSSGGGGFGGFGGGGDFGGGGAGGSW
jgi:uncharacterized protein